MLKWFYDDSDRGDQNIAEVKDIYTLVEKLQYRLEDLENEHMLLLKELAKIQNKSDKAWQPHFFYI